MSILQIYEDLEKNVRDSGESENLSISKEELLALLDAMSTFTKHENLVEMENMLGVLIAVNGVL